MGGVVGELVLEVGTRPVDLLHLLDGHDHPGEHQAEQHDRADDDRPAVVLDTQRLLGDEQGGRDQRREPDDAQAEAADSLRCPPDGRSGQGGHRGMESGSRERGVRHQAEGVRDGRVGRGIDPEQDRDRVGDEQQEPGTQQQPPGASPAGCGRGQSGDAEDEQHVTDGIGGTDQGPGRRPRPGVERRQDQQLDEDEGGAGADDPGLDPARAVARAAVVGQEQQIPQPAADRPAGGGGRRRPARGRRGGGGPGARRAGLREPGTRPRPRSPARGGRSAGG